MEALMYVKFVMWLISFMTGAQKKAVVLQTLDDIVDSRTNSIDKQTAELVLRKVIIS